jgi:ABC-type lipoprotein export system ATPase subunit
LIKYIRKILLDEIMKPTNLSIEQICDMENQFENNNFTKHLLDMIDNNSRNIVFITHNDFINNYINYKIEIEKKKKKKL